MRSRCSLAARDSVGSGRLRKTLKPSPLEGPEIGVDAQRVKVTLIVSISVSGLSHF